MQSKIDWYKQGNTIQGEEELFDYLKQYYYSDLKKTDKYNHTDCYTQSKVIELKCRSTHYTKLIIEKYKYEKIIKNARIKKKIPIYINSTPCGIFEWNLNNVVVDWVEQDNLPKTTEFENNDKVCKVVGLLNVSDAYEY